MMPPKITSAARQVALVLPAAALAALFAWGAGALWAAPLPRGAWVAAAVCWTAAVAVPAAGRSWRGALAAHAGGAMLFYGFLLMAKIAWPAALPWLRLWVLLGAALLLMRRLVARAENPGAEAARWVVLLAAGWWSARPFFTANLLGGLDARWYAYVLFDWLEQARAGVFPVLVGQGGYQFNGAVHPYRFAPYFQHLGGVIDLVTGRALGGYAVQHLTVIVSALGGAAAMYFSLVALAPQRRWMAALVGAGYALTPALGGLLELDMYMSYMTAPWLAVALGGVARWVEKRSGGAAVQVAVGLAILWACHAPVALWATLVAAGVLGASWLAHGAGWREARALAGMAALFAALAAYQIYGIIEVTPPAANAPRAGFALAWALALGLGAAGWVAARKFFPVPAPAVHGEGRGEDDAPARRAGWLLVAGAAVLALAAVFGGALATTRDPVVAGTVGYTQLFWPAALRPVSAAGALVSDVQPGFALLLLAALALAAAVLAREARARLLALALLVLTGFQLPFSHATAALWGLLPTSLLVATSGAVNLRLAPVWAALMAVAGFGALAWLAGARPRAHRWLFFLLALLLPWSAWESAKLARRIAALEFSAAESENFRRPENATLFIYSGNQIGSPPYFSHGVRDWRRESRVLDPQTFEVRPDLARAEPVPEGKKITFTIKPAGGAWELEPHLTLLRDEPLVTVWEFLGAVPEGTLTLNATDFAREYALPSSGEVKSFGSGATNSRELPLWTTSPYPEELTLRLLPAIPLTPAEVAAPPREFARVELRPLRDDWLPVRTATLVPFYRASVEVRAPALLETCRTWAPGYRATRNGRELAPVRTPAGLVGVPLEPGPNEIVVRFAGTPMLWRMGGVSLVAWAGVAVWLIACARGKNFLQRPSRPAV